MGVNLRAGLAYFNPQKGHIIGKDSLSVTFVHTCIEGEWGDIYKCLFYCYLLKLPNYVIFIKLFTETIQVTVGHKYFPQGLHVGQHCSRVYMYYIHSTYTFLYSRHAILHNILIDIKCSKKSKRYIYSFWYGSFFYLLSALSQTVRVLTMSESNMMAYINNLFTFKLASYI